PPGGTAPVASFTASPTSGTVPLAVSFTDTSTGGPTARAWEFGVGESGTLQNPSHAETAGGTSTARLTVVVAVSVDAVRELRSVIPGDVPPPGSTVIVRVLDVEPAALVA
ncbi:PKD domain-containing protein, partial [Arthrobacter pascens]|uniref:PKD domain-containing protein n=1 Tax=Arthrobacter pascens TaxID=1677 RepID=UPI00196A3698